MFLILLSLYFNASFTIIFSSKLLEKVCFSRLHNWMMKWFPRLYLLGTLYHLIQFWYSKVFFFFKLGCLLHTSYSQSSVGKHFYTNIVINWLLMKKYDIHFYCALSVFTKLFSNCNTMKSLRTSMLLYLEHNIVKHFIIIKENILYSHFLTYAYDL